jgi:uncharacterized membrane protein
MYKTKVISWTTLAYATIGAVNAVILGLVGLSLFDWQWWVLYSVFMVLHFGGLARGYEDGKRKNK